MAIEWGLTLVREDRVEQASGVFVLREEGGRFGRRMTRTAK